MEQQQRCIADENDLRKLYPPPVERARLKTLSRLDRHCTNFIARSPFVCLSTSSDRGADITPRGDEPGFVLVLDERTLAMPDWPGNNRLDSLTNIVLNPQVALLFFIPGVQETLRVNGVVRPPLKRDTRTGCIDPACHDQETLYIKSVARKIPLLERGGCGINKNSAKPTLAPQKGRSLTSHGSRTHSSK